MRALAVAMGVLFAVMLASWGQAETLISDEFETTVGAFTTEDTQATLQVVTDPELAYRGQGCLELAYAQRTPVEGMADGMPGTVVYNLSPAQPEMQGLRFAVATDYSTPLVLVAHEGDDGPRYQATLWSAAGAWNEVSLGLGDFVPDAEGPQDPDGKLTPAEITRFALIDVYQMLRGFLEAMPLFYLEPFHEQHIWLDQFELLTEDPVKRVPGAENEVVLARYGLPLTNVMPIGGQGVTLAREPGEEGTEVLRLEVQVPPQTVFGLVHMIRRGALAGAQSLRLRVKARRPAVLAISIQENSPAQAGEEITEQANYATMVQIPVAGQWQELVVPFSSFGLEEGAVDSNGKLDLDQVDNAVIVDITQLAGGGEAAGTLWLDSLVGEK